MINEVPARRWRGAMGTGKSAELRRAVFDVMESGVRPIAYLPSVSDVGLRTERVEFSDLDVAAALGADAFAGRLARNLSSGERQRVRLASALSGAIRFAALDEPCRHLDPEHVEALNVVLARRTSGGMHLAVGDGRGILESGLFQQELGAEVAHGPLPVRASVPTGQALRLEIPTPFLLSWTGRTATRQRVELERGALVVVRGPNGSGKTSLLEALARAAAKARARYGFSRQEPEHQVFATTPERELRDIAAVHDAAPWCVGGPVFGRLIDNLALEPWSTRPTPRLPLGVLSLFGVAIALWMGHDLVLLDEPTQGLDVRAARVLASELVRCAEEGARVVVASHDPELARVANREWLIANGELTESLPRLDHRGEPER